MIFSSLVNETLGHHTSMKKKKKIMVSTEQMALFLTCCRKNATQRGSPKRGNKRLIDFFLSLLYITKTTIILIWHTLYFNF